jgi:hypothetical protein
MIFFITYVSFDKAASCKSLLGLQGILRNKLMSNCVAGKDILACLNFTRRKREARQGLKLAAPRRA